MEGRGRGRPYGGALDLTSRAVHATRHVAGDDLNRLPALRVSRRVDGFDRARRRLARRPGETRSENGVDNPRGALQALGSERIGRGTGQPLEVRLGVSP